MKTTRCSVALLTKSFFILTAMAQTPLSVAPAIQAERYEASAGFPFSVAFNIFQFDFSCGKTFFASLKQ